MIQTRLSSGFQTGIMDDGVKITLLSTWLALFVVFAGRKFTQPIKVRPHPFALLLRSISVFSQI